MRGKISFLQHLFSSLLLHKAHLVVPWGLLVSTVVMLGPLKKKLSLYLLRKKEKAGLSKPQL